MARPKKQLHEARGQVLGIRLTDDERALIESRAASAGMPLSDYARRLIVRGQIATAVMRRADPLLVLAINRVGVNLNQIARAVNSDVGFRHAELTETLDRINRLLDQLQGAE